MLGRHDRRRELTRPGISRLPQRLDLHAAHHESQRLRPSALPNARLADPRHAEGPESGGQHGLARVVEEPWLEVAKRQGPDREALGVCPALRAVMQGSLDATLLPTKNIGIWPTALPIRELHESHCWCEAPSRA
eukprot:3560999-Pyramimonas_sp.AAC.1